MEQDEDIEPFDTDP